MTVISDTGPLNYLVLIGEEKILPHLFDRILIPQAVHRELNHERTPGKVRLWIESPPSWLEVRTIARLSAGLPSQLGFGDQEAILLAEKLGLDLLTDDAFARQTASRRSVVAVGTLGLLRDAALEGLLELTSAIQKARAAGLYATDELIERLLQSFNTLQRMRK